MITKCNHEPMFYGSASIGERGQIVIPSELRTRLNIKSGEKLMFFSNGELIFLSRTESLNKILEHMSKLLNLKSLIEDTIGKNES
jgi:AbrB family looped-hinge helix DNA binding protein